MIAFGGVIKKEILVGAAVVSAAVGTSWAVHMYKIVHPVYQTRTVEARSFRAQYPAMWPDSPSRAVKDPRLGDRDVIFENHDPLKGDPSSRWDYLEWYMFLNDKGTDYASLDQMIDARRQQQKGPGTVNEWQFANGITAKTWTSHVSDVDTSRVVREICFKGANGHYYQARYDIPGDWITEMRYNYFFKNILGSMEFKQ